jgi:3-methyladenine DNA glycosylase AlkD
MAKITLAVEPTFEADAKIPVPGVGFVAFRMTFKWRSKTELKAFFDSIEDQKNDAEAILAIATGWELDEKFDADNINRLIEKYALAPRGIYDSYINELALGRMGN